MNDKSRFETEGGKMIVVPPRQLLYLRTHMQTTGQLETLLSHVEAAGWRVHMAHTGTEAQALAQTHDIHVAFTGVDDPQFIQRELADTRLANEPLIWIAMLGHESLREETAYLIAEHFHDYHTLPADVERFLFSLGHAHGMAAIARAVRQSNLAPLDLPGMVGSSPIMQNLFRAIRKVASVDAPVLITGESGVGKELAALAIHSRSSRAHGPFVAVNCAALPTNLIQSELFGHERGAFTGAVSRKIGRIEAATGGTIFLDEIGDLPLELQVNLLRFLQEHVIERIGANEKIEVDVRVLAATHVNLEKAVQARRFREDLYYRLLVLHLKVPPLREREGDVELLARAFFDRFSRERRAALRGFSRKALAAMARHDWPGNVRELINRVRRAMVMSENRFITPKDLGLDERTQTSQCSLTLDQARHAAERHTIELCLKRSRNVSYAARQLGVSRVTLYRLMEQHGISVRG